MGKIFVAIYHFIQKYKYASLGIFLAFMILAGFNLKRLILYDDINQVFPQSDKLEIYNEVISNSSFLNQIVITIFQKDTSISPDPERLTAVATEFADSIALHLMPEFISSINAGADDQIIFKTFDVFYDYIPFYLDSSDYQNFDTLFSKEGLEKKMEENYKSLISPISLFTKKFILDDPSHIVLPKLDILRDIQLDDNLGLFNNFFVTRDKKNLLFFLLPVDAHSTSHNEIFISRLERIVTDIENNNSDISIVFYGAAPVAIANSRQLKKDIRITVSVALILLIFLMFFFFKQKRNIFLIFLPVVFGATVALSYFAFFNPQISVLSLAIGSVLLGISVDFSLHILTHHKHTGSPSHTLRDISEPVMMCGLTTITAFLCLLFISSPVLQNLGIFASISIFASAIGALILIPQFIKKNYSIVKEIQKHTFIERLAAIDLHKKRGLIVFILIVSVVLLYFTRFAKFEENLEESNFLTDELAYADKKIKKVTSVTERTIYVMTEGETLNECLEHNKNIINKLQQLDKENTFTSYHSISRIIPSKSIQKEKIKIWNNYWTSEKIEQVKSLMQKAGSKYHFNEKAYTGFFQMIATNYKVVSPDTILNKLDFVANNFVIPTSKRILLANLVKVSSEENSRIIYSSLRNQPNCMVFDRKFIAESLFNLLKSDFSKFINASLVVVFLIILLFLGRFELAVITFFSMLLSWGWTIGIMGIFGIKFNIFNVIISAFIFGLGIDYSIFVTKGLLHRYKYGSNNIISYKTAVILSSLTTLIGVGVLVFAKHPALKSIALLSIIGLFSVVFIAFTIQPVLFNILFYDKGKRRKLPVNLITFLYSSAGFFAFAIMALILTVLVPFFRIMPVRKARKKLWFRYLIYFFCKGFFAGTRPHIPKKPEGVSKELFKKPSIIISNHQSVLDLLLFLSLSPKILIMTNDWVWNNFFFGQIVRFAGFVNVRKEFEKTLPGIKQALEEGNSVLIFPEGSRTRHGKIRRFHKGAFYFAEKLNVDITAIILHGLFEALPSGKFITNPYSLTYRLIARIKPNTYGSNYSDIAKAVCKLYREEEHRMFEEKRNTDYYRRELINKYNFKGPIIEYYVKIKTRIEKNYKIYDELIPKDAHIIDLGCGLGMLTNMLSLTGKYRTVKGIDYDQNKIAIAQNTISEDQHNITFEYADITKYTPDFYDVFIMNDVLHYISTEKQKELIQKCISKLNPGGKIIIRDGNRELKNKHTGTVISEFFSTKFGFNKTQYKLSFFSASFIKQITKENQMELDIIDNTKITSNQVFILKS